GLVFVVRDGRVVNVRHLVEGELAVEAEIAVALVEVVAAVAEVLELLQSRVARLKARAVEQPPRAPARYELQSDVREPEPAAVLEGRVEVSHASKLFRDPTLAYEAPVALELLLRVVLCEQRVEDGLRGEHAALDGRVNTFEPLRVEEARRVAYEQEAVAVELRD